MKYGFARHLLAVAVLLAMLAHAAGLHELGAVRSFDALAYDAMVRLTMPERLDDRVVIVDIDEKSLAEFGRWPWGRDRMAALLSRLLAEGRVGLVAFNVVFPEPDESSGLPILARLAEQELKGEAEFVAAVRRLRPRLDHDAQFAEAIKGGPVVLGYYLSSREGDESTGILPPPALPAERLAGSRPTHWAAHGGNLPMFQRHAVAAGHFNPVIDADGVARRVPLLVEHGGSAYEALSLAVVRAWLGRQAIIAGPPSPAGTGRIEWLAFEDRPGARRVPVDANLAALVPYRGPQGSFRYVSAADVLAGRVPAERLAGRIALVGTTALGLGDIRATPVSEAYPGLEIHANLIAGMLDGKIKGAPANAAAIYLLQVIAVGLLMLLLAPRLSPLRATALALAILLALVVIHLAFWHLADLVVPVGAGVILLAVVYAIQMSWGYFVEARTRHQFARLFGQYVPPELVSEMAKDPARYSMEGRRQELTVLFCDIRDFTAIAEGMAPDRLGALLNEYLGAMTMVIRRRRGTLDKYIGDAIMAFWGAPVQDHDHARHAVLCALEMQAELAALGERLAAKGWPALEMGVGINTGLVTVGDMGSPVRRAYTVLGDAVNLASRLEGLTKEYGAGIIVGQRTRELLGDGFLLRELDRVRVKGRGEAVTIYEPVAGETATGAQKDEVEAWHRVLRDYRASDWVGAEQGLKALSSRWPRPLYGMFASRIASMRAAGTGEGWDGMWVFENK